MRYLWLAIGFWVGKNIFRRNRSLTGEELMARLRYFGAL